VIEILLTQALLYQEQYDQSRALTALERALALAEPEGYIRIFVDEGESMQLLVSEFRLTVATRDHPVLAYADRMLVFFSRLKKDGPQSKIENQKSKILVEPLSERELEVLKLLRSELSGPEIAQRLIVSLNTFRTHTKNIFNKLGVNNRRAAIRRAEELDLFQ
jgi:LuxR family maltose regulon positive regulatory protein